MSKLNSLSWLLAVLVLAISADSSAQQPQSQQPQYAAIFTVKNMCCAKESVPAIKALSKVEGVKRVTVDYKKRTLMIEATTVSPSPKAMWEVAERVKIEPIQLATPNEVYKTKPRQ